MLRMDASLRLTQLVTLSSRSLLPDGPSHIWRSPVSVILYTTNKQQSVQGYKQPLIVTCQL